MMLNKVNNEYKPLERECGQCNLCCLVFDLTGLYDFEKPAGVMCPLYDLQKGCTIHNLPKQDSICRDFKCAWKDPSVKVEKPDQCGYFFNQVKKTPKYTIVHAGMNFKPTLQYFLEIVSKFDTENNFQHPVIYYTYGENEVFVVPTRVHPSVNSVKVIQEIIFEKEKL